MIPVIMCNICVNLRSHAIDFLSHMHSDVLLTFAASV